MKRPVATFISSCCECTVLLSFWQLATSDAPGLVQVLDPDSAPFRRPSAVLLSLFD